jgi:hypothetical protein
MGEDDNNEDGRQDNLRMEMGAISENNNNSSNSNISDIVSAAEEK